MPTADYIVHSRSRSRTPLSDNLASTTNEYSLHNGELRLRSGREVVTDKWEEVEIVMARRPYTVLL